MKRIRIVTVLLALMMLCFGTMVASANMPAGTPAYIISGSSQGNAYTLEIKAFDILAFSGRIGIQFDTDKVALQGGDSLAAFQLGATVRSVPEVRPESDMVSASRGFACLAWYSSGLNALEGEQTVATLNFLLQDGVTAEDIDASTFRLRYLEEGEFGPWKSAASMQGWGDGLPTPYAYLTDYSALNVDFTYEGSDRAPANGHTVRLLCRNISGQQLAATLTLNGKTYSTDDQGAIELFLAPGDYMYRAVSDGYGDLRAKLTVSGDDEVTLLFINDADLVQKAVKELEIGYQKGDSAEKVTSTLILPQSTEDGVQISWESSESNIITREGLVYLPEIRGLDVTLTATLTRGDAVATKTFTVHVFSKAELRPVSPASPVDPSVPDNGEDTEQEPVTPVTPAASKFVDLAGYDWAKEAIEKMAAEGIIKGTSDTTFAPGDNIKRGDFVLLLMRMFNVNAPADEAFADVPRNSYYYEAIAQARALGIAQGTGDNRFNPEASITRQEMITFVMRALDNTGYLAVSAARDDLNSYKDKNLVAEYAFDSMSAAVAQGLIVGSNGILNPTGNTTRAEAAVFIARIYNAHHS